jgi:hypothetical protein
MKKKKPNRRYPRDPRDPFKDGKPITYHHELTNEFRWVPLDTHSPTGEPSGYMPLCAFQFGDAALPPLKLQQRRVVTEYWPYPKGKHLLPKKTVNIVGGPGEDYAYVARFDRSEWVDVPIFLEPYGR